MGYPCEIVQSKGDSQKYKVAIFMKAVRVTIDKRQWKSCMLCI